MKNADHRRLLQTRDRGIGHRGDGRDAQRLPGEASLADVTPFENGHHCFLTVTGERSDFDLSFFSNVLSAASPREKMHFPNLALADAC